MRIRLLLSFFFFKFECYSFFQALAARQYGPEKQQCKGEGRIVQISVTKIWKISDTGCDSTLSPTHLVNGDFAPKRE
jgi:hypothetical protein